MPQKEPRSVLALRYAAMPPEKRESIPDSVRVEILARSFAHGETAVPIAKDAMRAAQMQWLLSHPFTDSDRIGRFASLLMETLPERAVVLCLFDAEMYMIDAPVLTYGAGADPAEYAPRIPIFYKKSGASYAALLFAPFAAQYGYTLNDLRQASGVYLFCQRQNIPILECVVAKFQQYVPLLRRYGQK